MPATAATSATNRPPRRVSVRSMAETTVLPKATPTLSVSGPLSGTAGSPIPASSISATLAGGSAPTGTITLTVFGPQSSPPTSCASGGATVGTASVNGNGTYQPSAGLHPAQPRRVLVVCQLRRRCRR